MIYSKLAAIYDGLVKDEEATKQWVLFVKQNIKGKKILELACGSGEITRALAKAGYDVLATDISSEMLAEAQAKGSFPNLKYQMMDMRDLRVNESYDGIICFCDSINYLEDYQALQKLFLEVYIALNHQGVFLFDMHQEDRLNEFRDGWQEEGRIDDVDYKWEIISQGEYLVHDFTLISENQTFMETHRQRVFTFDRVEALLSDCGFSFEVKDDYDIFSEDLKEKYFFVARKANS